MDQTTQTVEIEEIKETEPKPKPKTRKPRDPDYFKKYYIERVKGVKFFCKYCYCDITKDNFKKHQKTVRHLRLMEKQKAEENYSEFD